jgi:hypothetical protein
MSSSAIARRVAEGSWRVVHPGVYLVDTTPLTNMGRVWAAVLSAQSPTGSNAGRGAANHAARLGETTLRSGWREVMASPCGIAAEVAQVLSAAGRAGRDPAGQAARSERPTACRSGWIGAAQSAAAIHRAHGTPADQRSTNPDAVPRGSAQRSPTLVT